MIPSLSTAREARKVLSKHLPITRLMPAHSLTRHSSGPLYLKLETELPTGSFKPRGALHALSMNMARRRVKEVTASSTGNHGAAVAWAAKLFGIPATIFLPENPNPVKRDRIAKLGAKIVELGSDISAAASAYGQTEGGYYLNDATDPDLPAGPATIACEILEQLPETETICVPMGDTALIRGIAAAAKQLSPKIRIVGVQAERAPSYLLSWKQGRVVPTDTCDTIADGLATNSPEAANVQAIRELVDDVCVVSEAEMLGAIRHLLLEEHIVAEPAGAAATAALLNGKSKFAGPTVLLVTGANIAPEVLRAAVCSTA
jgi:threonine dehydratase